MADELGLPRSTVQKSIKELLPKEMRIAGDASELLVQCCNQFVHLVSTQANDISEREKRTTISPEHVVKALEELEFGEAYLQAVRAAWEEWKADNKEHKAAGNRKGDTGMTQQQLIELQQKLFQEARAATLSGPLPSMTVEQAAAVAAAVSGAAAQQQPPQQQQQQTADPALPEQQQAAVQPETQGQAAVVQPTDGAGAGAASGADDGAAAVDEGGEEELGDDLDVDSEMAD